MKILIATDGSECAKEAQDDLRRAGMPDTAEAIVLCVADVWLSPEGVTDLPEAWNETAKKARAAAEAAVLQAQRIAEADARNLQEIFPGWTIHTKAIADSPGWGIITQAEHWGADLILTGAHGRSFVDRMILGSVSQKVLTHAHCAVRIGRKTKISNAPVKLIVAMDGSPGAKLAIEKIAGRRWPAGSEVRIVAVLDPRLTTSAISYLPTAAHWIHESFRDEDAWIRSVVEQQTQILKESGLPVTSHIEEGDPKRILLEQAREWEADCIFLGARGLTRVERFLLGTVSGAVAARAGCSVEVVRR